MTNPSLLTQEQKIFFSQNAQSPSEPQAHNRYNSLVSKVNNAELCKGDQILNFNSGVRSRPNLPNIATRLTEITTRPYQQSGIRSKAPCGNKNSCDGIRSALFQLLDLQQVQVKTNHIDKPRPELSDLGVQTEVLVETWNPYDHLPEKKVSNQTVILEESPILKVENLDHLSGDEILEIVQNSGSNIYSKSPYSFAQNDSYQNPCPTILWPSTLAKISRPIWKPKIVNETITSLCQQNSFCTNLSNFQLQPGSENDFPDVSMAQLLHQVTVPFLGSLGTFSSMVPSKNCEQDLGDNSKTVLTFNNQTVDNQAGNGFPEIPMAPLLHQVTVPFLGSVGPSSMIQSQNTNDEHDLVDTPKSVFTVNSQAVANQSVVHTEDIQDKFVDKTDKPPISTSTDAPRFSQSASVSFINIGNSKLPISQKSLTNKRPNCWGLRNGSKSCVKSSKLQSTFNDLFKYLQSSSDVRLRTSKSEKNASNTGDNVMQMNIDDNKTTFNTENSLHSITNPDSIAEKQVTELRKVNPKKKSLIPISVSRSRPPAKTDKVENLSNQENYLNNNFDCLNILTKKIDYEQASVASEKIETLKSKILEWSKNCCCERKNSAFSLEETSNQHKDNNIGKW